MAVKQFFGTDGIRGRVGSEFINAEFMLKLGWAVGKVLAAQGGSAVLIGKDTRVSGYMIESALEAGLSAAGIDTLLLGPMPTPTIAYLTKQLNAAAGIVISASHNPYYDNGVKLFDAKGMKLSDQQEQAIEHQLNLHMQTTTSEKLGKASRINDAPQRYLALCKTLFSQQCDLSGVKVVVDCANGAGYQVAPEIFRDLGAQVIAIGVEPDGFNINKHCGATDTALLEKTVLKESADIGVALDGDGDRLIMVDHVGEVVDGDELLCVLSQHSKFSDAQQMGIVGTVMTNLGLEQYFMQQKIAFDRAAVGDRYVLEKLLQKGWLLGGESSGHIVNLNYTTTGDGIISALQVLSVLQDQQNSLHHLKKKMSKCPQVLINVPMENRVDISQSILIQQAIIASEKKLADRGRVLLRASGTEPLMRVMVEGNDALEVQTTADELANIVRAEIETH